MFGDDYDWCEQLYIVCCSLRPGHVIRGRVPMTLDKAEAIARSSSKMEYWVERVK
jgi:hypothetical protein